MKRWRNCTTLLMKQYDSNDDYVNPVNGLTGLLVTDEAGDSYKKIIAIPESIRNEMFHWESAWASN